MSNYSEAEISATQACFPVVKSYICDFHREQAWERWAKNHKHDLSSAQTEELLVLLRACAWAPSCSSDKDREIDHFFKLRLRN